MPAKKLSVSYAILRWSQVKIARALSVAEEKGLVSDWARLWSDETVCRGKRVALWSGAEKSRQTIHDVDSAEDETW